MLHEAAGFRVFSAKVEPAQHTLHLLGRPAAAHELMPLGHQLIGEVLIHFGEMGFTS